MVTLRMTIQQAKKLYICDVNRHHTIRQGEKYIYMYGNATDEPMYALRWCRKCVIDYDYCNTAKFNELRKNMMEGD